MATFTKVNDFVLNLAEVIDLDGDAWEFELCLTDPAAGTNVTADGNGIKGSVAPITYSNYTDDLTADRVWTAGNLTHAQASGTLTFDYTADVVITASGGAIPDWRYIVMFDETVGTPLDPVSNYWDHGSTISLADTDSATLQVNASGFWTLA